MTVLYIIWNILTNTKKSIKKSKVQVFDTPQVSTVSRSNLMRKYRFWSENEKLKIKIDRNMNGIIWRNIIFIRKDSYIGAVALFIFKFQKYQSGACLNKLFNKFGEKSGCAKFRIIIKWGVVLLGLPRANGENMWNLSWPLSTDIKT